VNISSYIDHTLLRSNATKKEILKLCGQAGRFGFKTVCVNPYFVPFCKKALKGCGVQVCCVVGFPLGAAAAKVKVFEARQAALAGADEIDMVMNIGAFKDKAYSTVAAEIRSLKKAIGNRVLKVIIETSLLSANEIKKASAVAESAGADFIKTSTGFAGRGATARDIKLIRSVVRPGTGIKASGGIKSFNDAVKLIEAGATRIGSSSSVAIMAGRK
jgi:deoxyribose-phosphate aldolase